MPSKQKCPAGSYPSFCMCHSIHTRQEIVTMMQEQPLKPHRHNTAEILLAVSGKSRIICDGIVKELNAPYIVHYPANVPHVQDNSDSEVFERYCFPIIPSDINASDSFGDVFFAVELTDDQLRRIRAYTDIMYEYYGFFAMIIPNTLPDTSPQDILRLRLLLLLFINEFKPMIGGQITTNVSYIDDVCAYIGDNYGSHLTIDILADKFFVGRAKLTKDFRQMMSMSVVEYITTVRINHAKSMLYDYGTLDGIAQRCGFSSVSYFIKVFTKLVQLTPAQYRHVIRSTPENQ